VEDFLAKVARTSRHSQEEKETGQDMQNPTTIEHLSESDTPTVILVEADGSQGGTEAGPTTTEKPSKNDRSDGISTDVDNTEGRVEEYPTVTPVPEADGFQGGTEVGPTATEKLSKSDRSDGTSADVNNLEDRVEEMPNVTEVPEKNDNVRSVMDDANDQNESEHKVSQTAAQAQSRDEDLPTCGECNGSLSFPFWYCIYCEDNLFICDKCDGKGVTDLIRGSGKHTEEHHLIRCMKPWTDCEAVSSPEQQLLSIEGRLADMQTQFADMQTKFNDFSARVGYMEELLHRLAETARSN